MRPEFAKVPVAVFADGRLGSRDLRVLGVLYAHADAEGICWPSRVCLGELTRIDQRHVKRALIRLQQFGWVVVLPGAGRGRLTQYCLTVSADEKGDDSAPFSDDETGAESAPFSGGEKGAGLGQKGGRFVQKRGPIRAEKGASLGHVEQTRNIPGRDQEQEHARAEAREADGDGLPSPPAPPSPRSGAAVDRNARFERFWSAYPKRRNKGDALKAWKVLNPGEDLTARMLAAIEQARASEDWRKEGGKFIPYPATWLRGRGWEDELQVEIEPLATTARGAESGRIKGTVDALQSLFGEGTDGHEHFPGGHDVPVGRVWDGTLEGAGGGVLGPTREPGRRPLPRGCEGARWTRAAIPDRG